MWEILQLPGFQLLRIYVTDKNIRYTDTVSLSLILLKQSIGSLPLTMYNLGHQASIQANK